MNEKGYIKLYRSILGSSIYGLDENGRPMEPFDKAHAWIDLLLICNYGETETTYKGKIAKTLPGQIKTSISTLATRWGWSSNKVRRYLGELSGEGMVHTDGTTDGTTITIEKWAFYQGQRRTERRANRRADGTADGTLNKNIKEDKRSIKNPLTPTGGECGGSCEPDDPAATDESWREFLKSFGGGNND